MLEQKVRILMGEWKRAHVGTHAASTAFFVFMSIIPLLILYVSLVPTSGLSQQEMALVLCDMVPDVLDDLVTTLVNEAYEKSGLGFSLSLLTLFWTASQGASELRGGLNAMYDIEEDRNRVAVAAISIFFIVALLATLTFVLSLVFSGVIDRVMAVIVPSSHAQDLMMTTFQSIAVFAIGTLEFAACYTFLTAGKRGFRAQLPGAVLAAVAWYLFSLGFRVYLDHANRFTAFYGSLGAVALFLFWMYWVFYILLVGAFLNRVLSEGRAERPTR